MWPSQVYTLVISTFWTLDLKLCNLARFLRPPDYWTSVGAFYLNLGSEVTRHPPDFFDHQAIEPLLAHFTSTLDLKSCKHLPDFFDRLATKPLSAHFSLFLNL